MHSCLQPAAGSSMRGRSVSGTHALPHRPCPHPQLLPAVSRKPPQLRLHGHQRLWGWLQPVFTVSDEELVRSAGLDALIGVSPGGCGVELGARRAAAGRGRQ